MAFDLGLHEDFSRDGFFPSPANAAALATIAGWTDWPLRRLLLIGPGGAGKTHLAHIWAAEAGAMIPDGSGAFVKDERGAVVAACLASPELRQMWEDELGGMRDRIRAMRREIQPSKK
jgi:chromosomal replication initiation ATPase DnaA